MARNKKKPAESGFVLYDVVYQDGSRSSHRKVPSAEIDPFDRDGSVRALLERQDREIAETYGRPRGAIKSFTPANTPTAAKQPASRAGSPAPQRAGRQPSDPVRTMAKRR
jgi:hypothetical protein